jgi:transcriptional regulator with GAF, ATPase, and Fis domain
MSTQDFEIETADATEFPINLIDIENLHTRFGNSRIAKTSSTEENSFCLQEEICPKNDFAGIVGESSTLRKVFDLVTMVAPIDSTVLLLGETGTGKELIARAIHDRSRRKQRTLVKLNCAAIPTGLLESELFGHEKGAFTGAVNQKIGRLELADQGTLPNVRPWDSRRASSIISLSVKACFLISYRAAV